MTDKALWNKIEAFDFDTPISEYGFSTRLAHENYWTKNFTEKAITEYKKFIYLAAISENMVSPSPIVDTVWHQHLIFTTSYNNLCAIAGKQIQHIPATHHGEEFAKFKQAKNHTQQLYEANFGQQSEALWHSEDMYHSLALPKAQLKIRAFTLIGLLVFALLITPFHFLLKPIYIHIGNPDFLLGISGLCLFALVMLEWHNQSSLAKIVNGFKKNTFIHDLAPSELIYLKTQNLAHVVHSVVNELIETQQIVVADLALAPTLKRSPKNLEEHQTLNAIHSFGKTKYAPLLNHLLQKPVFVNTANCMDAFQKYFVKSKAFAKIFYTNFIVLALLLLLALSRQLIGIERDKPVLEIGIFVLLFALLIILFLWRLTRLVATKSIPSLYKRTLLPQRSAQDNNDWQYFLFSHTMLATSFMPIVNDQDRYSGGSGCSTSSDSSSGSSCGGSSCGSSCGGCGGGGD